MKCDTGHYFSMIPSNFMRGQNCSKCMNRSLEHAGERFYNELSRWGYKALGEYQGAHGKMKIICEKNHESHITPNNFRRRRNCPGCNIRRSTQQIREEFEENVLDFDVIIPYASATKKVKLRCKKCGKEIERFPVFRRPLKCCG